MQTYRSCPESHAKALRRLTGLISVFTTGLMAAATYVHSNTAGALAAAGRDFPGWPLFLTGHSMGGALLSEPLQHICRRTMHPRTAVSAVACQRMKCAKSFKNFAGNVAGPVHAAAAAKPSDDSCCQSLRWQCHALGGRWAQWSGEFQSGKSLQRVWLVAGAVASLVTMLLHEHGLPPGIGRPRCVGIGPAAVMSSSLAEASRPYVTSVCLR